MPYPWAGSSDRIWRISMSSVPCGMGKRGEGIDTSSFDSSGYPQDRSKVKVWKQAACHTDTLALTALLGGCSDNHDRVRSKDHPISVHPNQGVPVTVDC